MPVFFKLGNSGCEQLSRSMWVSLDAWIAFESPDFTS
jgi:hypothetical protein